MTRQARTAAAAAEYLAKLVAAYPSIREVWLFGSRANGSDKAESDWDYMAFADEATYAALQRDLRFHCDGIDLMIVRDGSQFAKPWTDDGRPKGGTLAKEPGGFYWERLSSAEATYRATKAPDAEGLNVRIIEQRALRVYPVGPDSPSMAARGPSVSHGHRYASPV